MEKHGIGTDASISVHINTVCVRGYVTVQGRTRTLVPNDIGIALTHGYCTTLCFLIRLLSGHSLLALASFDSHE